ncbi:MAG: carbon-nitrogen hydrolase family protein [Candidatus Dormibacteria bacterium]
MPTLAPMKRSGLMAILVAPLLLVAQLAVTSPALALSPNCGGGPPEVRLTGGGQVRVFAMQHKQDLTDNATYQSIKDSLDCELAARVDPYRATDHPNVVVYNELIGLSYGTEGSRGFPARNAASTATFVDTLAGQAGAAGIGGVAVPYAGPIAYYTTVFGPPADTPSTIDRLFTAITDTMVRAVVENVSSLARAHGVYIVFGAPMVTQEGAACTGKYAGWAACPGWHNSTSPADVAALADPDLATGSRCVGEAVSPCVYVADTTNVDNVAMFFAPDGTLYDMQPKVNLTGLEINPLGWHQANAATIHAIGLRGADATRFPAVKFGVGISLDAFETEVGSVPCPAEADPGMKPNHYPRFMQCLDSKGVNVFLQPEFNDGSAACMSWTDFTENCGPMGSWQPLSWMRSAWFAVQGRKNGSFVFPHFQYAVNPFMVGNLFDIVGDGQSAIFSRDDPRASVSWYSGDSADALYNGAGVGIYTDRADDPAFRQFEGPRPGFLALARWIIPEGTPASLYRCKPASPGSACPVAPGDAGSLQSCEKGLAPGSGVTTGPCAENAYRVTALVADLFPTPGEVAAPSTPAATAPQALPLTARGPRLPRWIAPLGLAVVLIAGLSAAGARRRRS